MKCVRRVATFLMRPVEWSTCAAFHELEGGEGSVSRGYGRSGRAEVMGSLLNC